MRPVRGTSATSTPMVVAPGYTAYRNAKLLRHRDVVGRVRPKQVALQLPNVVLFTFPNPYPRCSHEISPRYLLQWRTTAQNPPWETANARISILPTRPCLHWPAGDPSSAKIESRSGYCPQTTSFHVSNELKEQVRQGTRTAV